MSSPRIIRTKAGDQTLYVEHLDETYHSRDGAVTESQHVFIEQGLQTLLRSTALNSVRIFELGFGTGLNALVSLAFSRVNKISIYYESIEAHPLDKEIAAQMDYYDFMEGVERSDFETLHSAAWNEIVSIEDQFELQKIHGDFLTYSPAALQFDLVYFDAFAPKKQAELWSLDQIQKCYNCLVPGGILVCYSASGQFKRDLRTCGFRLEHPPGANGKREMTRAIK